MNLYLTRKLQDKLKVELTSAQNVPPFFSWRANYIQGHGQRFVVFMNDASVAKLKKLPEFFVENLRKTLLALCINPEIIDLYIAQLGKVNYIKNSDRTQTARLNKCTDAVWFALHDYTDDTELSVWANDFLHGAPDNSSKDYTTPKENFLNALSIYNLPIFKTRALDLNIRLDLNGRDAVRKLRVPETISFNELHNLLQTAFGWKSRHLHSFGFFKEWIKKYGAAPDVELFSDKGSFENNPNASSTDGRTLADFVPEFNKILYIYDFGDYWCHYIDIENIIDGCEDKLPLLLSGTGDSPPEDVGGSAGFSDFLEIMSNPNHKDYEDFFEWSKMQMWEPFNFDRIATMVCSQR